MTRFVRFLRSHRSFTATGIATVVIAAVAATIGLTSPGYQAQRLDLNDGTVWVANQSKSAIGRANPAVLELNSAVRSSGTDVSVVQDAAHVLLVDRSNATVGVVDTATADVAQTVPLPPDKPDVLLAGGTAVIVSGQTGEFWSTAVSALGTFDSSSQADLSLGSSVVTGMTPSGTMIAYSPDSSEVSRIDSLSEFGVSSHAKLQLPKGDTYQVATVGTHWAVLDTDTNLLVIDGKKVDLSRDVTGKVALQQSSDTGSAVTVASKQGLLDVSFGGSVSKAVSGRSGNPARPVIAGGCTYAAWADGTGWNDCSTSAGSETPLTSMAASASLAFAINGSEVVLNDEATGDSWAVQRNGQLIDNWSDLINDETDTTDPNQKPSDDPDKLEVQQKPPVAKDDLLGARPSRATLLPVLLNDYDPNGDPIVITDVSKPSPSSAKVEIVANRQQILLTLPATAAGSVTFDYSISDGRGGTDSAHVTVGVHQIGTNSAPQQVRAETAGVSSSGRVSVNTLGSWVDPDGDPFYLTGASGASGGTVTFKPTGEVVYQDSGEGPSTQDIVLSMSDGSAVGRGTLTIKVSAGGDVPLSAASFSVETDKDKVTTINPMPYASGGTGSIKLNSVPAKSGATITPSYSAGTFTFQSSVGGPHLLEYTVTDGDKTASGTIRVDVVDPPEPNTAPITIPKTVFVQTLSTQTVDITASDFDPAGNVLMVTKTVTPSIDSGVQVQTLEQRDLRITLTRVLDAPVTFTYTVSNGLASAPGSVTVVQIPKPDRLQPPIATNDQVTARVGAAVDIDVLANDEQPDGEDITLEPKLVKNVASGGGLLFVSGTKLRYLAPKNPGNFTAEYAIEGPDGQRATAQVSIAVRESDASTNTAPVPETLTARVVAGQSVRVQVPLDDIDPDGDSVQLLGVDTNPEKGNVASVGSDYIDYDAGSYSAGTDTFTYTVVDGLGARATGTIRIGIAPKAQGSSNPIAVADTVTMRPGGSILVRVLANDSDPDGGSLRVTSVKPSDADVTATILAGGVVRVTPPRAAKTYGLVYTVANDTGGTSSTFISVKVDPDSELNYPEAQDSVLTLTDVLNRKTVDVNVLANVFFADGNVSTLGLGLVPGYGDTAQVTANHRIRVTITDTSQIIPFWVSHPDDSSIKAYAFIRVPGFDDALPQINETAPALSVVSEKALTIDLNRYVVSTGSNGVRLTDSSTVRATHADGADLVQNATTLVFTSEKGFFGQASISFQVTDGTSADDPDGHTATLVLPITVTARQNQPPVLEASALDLEPNESRTLDLTRLTTYNYPNDVGELKYAVTTPSVPGFTVRLSGTQLTVTASSSATKGTSARIGLTVRDNTSAPQSGTVGLTVVGSTRPLAIAESDEAVARRGSTTVVDVLANDQATNPFPGQPLKVIAIRGLEGASLPAGVTVKPSGDNSKLTVTVAKTAKPVNAHLQYEIADVTGDPDRYVFGDITISVQDVPDAPAAPIRSGTFVGGQLTLAYQAPVSNNSAITSYRLTGTSSAGSYTKDCGTSTVCTLTDLDPGALYRFSVQAINSIGESASSPQSIQYSADFVPTAPTGVSVSPSTVSPGAVVVSWNTVPKPARGTSVTGYTVEIAGSGAPGSVDVAAGSTSTTITGLSPGAQYSVQVYAKNSAQVSSPADWARSATASGSPAGTPSSVTGITASSDKTGVITIAWAGVGSNGGSGISYTVGRADSNTPAGTPACSTTSKPGAIGGAQSATSYRDATAVDGRSYVYYVYADNGYFCSSARIDGVQSLTAPGQATATLSLSNSSNGNFDVHVDSLSVASGTSPYYQVKRGGVWTSVAVGDTLTSAADASVYGNAQAYTFRGCRDATTSFCGPVSDELSITPVSTNVSGLDYENPEGDTGTWSFNYSAASNPSYELFEYQCSGGTWTTAVDGANSCQITGVDLLLPTLNIRVTANGGQTYEKTYRRSDTP